MSFLVFPALAAFSQQAEPEGTGLVKWIDLKTAQELNKTQPKPLLIDVYTDWCGWCKHMMKTTFSNQGLADYINAYFYPVRLNAETKDSIVFLDKKYYNKNTGARPPHDLAITLLEGKLSYPTIVLFNNNYKFKMLVPGYLSAKDIEPVLVYTVEYIFNTTSVDDFRNYFNKAFYPDTGNINKDSITWLKSFNNAVEKNKKERKKTFVFVNTGWCNGGKTMLKSTFNNSIVTKYIKDHFHPVMMDARSTEPVTFQNQTFTNTSDNATFHPFLHHLVGEHIVLPSILFFDEDMNFISQVGQYLTPESLFPVLQYFAEDKYKVKKWEDFFKEYKENKDQNPIK